MKRIIAAALVLSFLGGVSAEAAPYFYRGHHLVARHVVVGPRHHVWMRGEHFRPVYGRPIVVNDWGFYRLRRPPVGYHWVRDRDRFLLVALTTGVIADIMLTNGYGY